MLGRRTRGRAASTWSAAERLRRTLSRVTPAVLSRRLFSLARSLCVQGSVPQPQPALRVRTGILEQQRFGSQTPVMSGGSGEIAPGAPEETLSAGGRGAPHHTADNKLQSAPSALICCRAAAAPHTSSACVFSFCSSPGPSSEQPVKSTDQWTLSRSSVWRLMKPCCLDRTGLGSLEGNRLSVSGPLVLRGLGGDP
ncbi:unnamed protein product [Lota lota]